MPLTNTQLAYIAGIIDGEGCIRTNNQGDSVIIRVHVTNTNLNLILRLKEWFGGYTWINDNNKYNSNAKAAHVWEVSAKKAALFLQQILPYLFLKREQANLVLALQETKGTGSTKVTKEVYQIRAEIVSKLHTLNKKGASI